MLSPILLRINSTSVLLFGVTLGLSYIVVKFNKRKTKGKKSPPCLPSLPFIGSLPFIPTDFAQIRKFFMEKAEELGPVFAFYSGSKYTLVLNGREAIEDAYVKHAHDFADRSRIIFEKDYADVHHKALVHIHYDDEYKIRRKLSLSIMKVFGFGETKIIESKAHSEIETMIQEFTSFRGTPTDPIHVLFMSVSNVILEIVIGHRFDHSDSRFHRLLQYTHEYMTNTPLDIDIMPLLQYVPSVRRKILNNVKALELFFEILESEIQDGLNSSGDNFVKRYVAAKGGKSYDEEELKYVVRDLVLGGIDISTIALLWAMIMLANNPKVQSSIREEIDSVVPRTRLPSLDDKPNLPYTEASMTELLRWRSLIPLGVPRQTLRDTEVNGFHIPVGTQVIANLWSANMNPKVWVDPEMIKPERFLDSDGKFFGGERMLSFSLGRRSCLGEGLARREIFLFFTALVQQFEILPPEGQTSIDDLEEVTLFASPLPFNVRLIPRT